MQRSAGSTKCACVGKGWYNLNESNYETYCFSKMRALLVVTRFMMEDTLRSLVMDNYLKFVAFVNAACNAKVNKCNTTQYACMITCTSRVKGLEQAAMPRLTSSVTWLIT